MSLSDLTLTSSSDEEAIPRPIRNFRQRINPFFEYNDVEFKNRYRLSKSTVAVIESLIGAEIQPFTHRNHALSPMEQLLLAISFYATGAFQITVADNVRVHKSTACRIIQKVTKLLANLRPLYIKMPTNEQQCNVIKNGFYNITLFPNVIGAIDCTHIKIQSPGRPNGEIFRNRKGYFSLNVQAICDANLKILDIICRWPGSVHDSTILNNSHIRADFEAGTYGNGYLLGDGGYPCMSYLLTPILHPANRSEEEYNKAQISTRNPIERCFGVLKRRFPCLSSGMRVKTDTVMSITVACAVLHNIAIGNNDANVEDLPVVGAVLANDVHQDVVHNNENTSVRSSLLATHFNY